MSHSGRLIDRPGARVNSPPLRKTGTSEKGRAMTDDDLPRRQGDMLAALIRQPLDPLSVDELDERVALLEAEIERVRAHKAAATSHKAIAESLFRKGRSEEHTSELQSLMRISYAVV